MNIRMLTNIGIYIFLLSVTYSLYSKNVYVSTQGSDKYEGTQSKPVRSFSKAGEMLNPGDTCFIFGGVYHQTLRPEIQASINAPVVFRAVKGADVVISAMNELQNPQRSGDTLIYKVDRDFGSHNTVMHNGTPLILARWPNKTNLNMMDIEGAVIGAKKSSPQQIYSPDFPDKWSDNDLEGATLWANAERKWSAWTSHVTGYNAKEKLIKLKGFGDSWWVNERHNPSKIHRRYGKGIFFIANAEVLLDAPGEWYYDSIKGILKVILPQGAVLSESTIGMKKRRWAVDFSGSSNVKVVHVNMRGVPVNAQEQLCRRLYHMHVTLHNDKIPEI